MSLDSVNRTQPEIRQRPLPRCAEFAQAPERLRLGPAMHRNLVPTEEELAALERSVWLLPSPEQIL